MKLDPVRMCCETLVFDIGASLWNDSTAPLSQPPINALKVAAINASPGFNDTISTLGEKLGLYIITERVENRERWKPSAGMGAARSKDFTCAARCWAMTSPTGTCIGPERHELKLGGAGTTPSRHPARPQENRGAGPAQQAERRYRATDLFEYQTPMS